MHRFAIDMGAINKDMDKKVKNSELSPENSGIIPICTSACKYHQCINNVSPMFKYTKNKYICINCT